MARKKAGKKKTTKKKAVKRTKKTAGKKKAVKKTARKKASKKATKKAAPKKAAKKKTRKTSARKTTKKKAASKKTVKKGAKKATKKKGARRPPKKKAASVPVKKVARPRKPRRTKHEAPPEVERPARPAELETPVTPAPPAAPPVVPPAAPVEEPPRLQVGDWAPTFELPDQTGQMHSLWKYRGQWITLYFYPKDDTPGCTTEACGFRDAMAGFTDRNAPILGISPDDVASHQRFVQKYSLTFPLLADENHQVAEDYGVWVEKNMYGQKKMGIARTTFIISPEGRVAHVFRNVKADGHEQQVLEKLNELQAASQ